MKHLQQPPVREDQQQPARAKQLSPDQVWLNLTPRQQQAFIQKLEIACHALLPQRNNAAEGHHDQR